MGQGEHAGEGQRVWGLLRGKRVRCATLTRVGGVFRFAGPLRWGENRVIGGGRA